MSPDELRVAALALPTGERLKLVEELWNIVELEDTTPFTPAQLAELERREAHLKANPDSLLTWEQVWECLQSCYRT